MSETTVLAFNAGFSCEIPHFEVTVCYITVKDTAQTTCTAAYLEYPATSGRHAIFYSMSPKHSVDILYNCGLHSSLGGIALQATSKALPHALLIHYKMVYHLLKVKPMRLFGVDCGYPAPCPALIHSRYNGVFTADNGKIISATWLMEQCIVGEESLQFVAQTVDIPLWSTLTKLRVGSPAPAHPTVKLGHIALA